MCKVIFQTLKEYFPPTGIGPVKTFYHTKEISDIFQNKAAVSGWISYLGFVQSDDDSPNEDNLSSVWPIHHSLKCLHVLQGILRYIYRQTMSN
jgi:hypothetical protein